MYWPENGTHIELGKGRALRLCYRVVVHAGEAESARIAGIFEQYKQGEGE
jgi:hypothetical protein